MFALLTILKWGVPALILAAPFILTALYPSARRFLMAAIPIPLFVLAALAAWLWLNQESAILGAVQVRVKEMVAGAELDAAKAVNEQLRRRNELPPDLATLSVRELKALARERRLNIDYPMEKSELVAKIEATFR